MKMFSKMYLEELRHARQWKSIKPSVEAGDLVLLVEKDVAQGHWQTAVVKDAHPLVNALLLSNPKLANTKTHHPIYPQ
jgi:hypothetical protein